MYSNIYSGNRLGTRKRKLASSIRSKASKYWLKKDWSVVGNGHRRCTQTIRRAIRKHYLQAPQDILTPFGWTVIGGIPSSVLNSGPSRRFSCHFGSIHDVNDRLVELVEKYHSTESFGTLPYKMGESDARTLHILRSTVRNVGSRYELKLLWKAEVGQLSDNRIQAMHRFFAIERRILRNEDTANQYTKAVENT